MMLTALMIAVSPLTAQQNPQYLNYSGNITKQVELEYYVYVPDNYRPNEAWPLVLWLPGDESAGDMSQVRNYGLPKAIDEGLEFDYIVAAPGLPGNVHWDPDALNALVLKIADDYHVDLNDIAVAGQGTGGFGVYELACSYPGTYARLAPMGALALGHVTRASDSAIWIFHGAQDTLVPLSSANYTYGELSDYTSADVQLTVFDSLGHSVSDSAFADPVFIQWLTGTAPSWGSTSGSPSLETFSTGMTNSIDDDYLLYLPGDYSQTGPQWPLVVSLHGAGNSIYNIEDVREAGPPLEFEQGRNNDFVLVCPQLHADVHWDPERLYALTMDIVGNYNISQERIYLTGLSRGGAGTWEFAASYPNLFAAVVPIAAHGVPAVERLAGTNIQIFHGEYDPVPVEGAQYMYNRLSNAGANVNITVYSGVGHNSWDQTYSSDGFWSWLLAQQIEVTAVDNPHAIPQSFELHGNYPNPFNPVTTIRYELPSRADVRVTVFDLLGNEVATLVSGFQEAGVKSVRWKASGASSGIYIYQVRVGNNVETGKMALLK